MKLLILLLAIIITTTGVIICDEGMVKQVFQFGFFGSLGIGVALLVMGNLD